jgi:hypothetical protein
MARALRVLQPRTLGSDEARSYLQTDFARAAFDRLNRMRPQWRILGTGADADSALAPDISVFDEKGHHRKTLLPDNRAGSIDDSVVAAENTLKDRIAKVGARAIVMANSEDDRKLYFSYDPATGNATPYQGVLPPRRNNCCMTGCGGCLWGNP